MSYPDRPYGKRALPQTTPLREVAALGRKAGRIYASHRAANTPAPEGLALEPWNMTKRQWDAYLAGMYRAAGYEGSGNRHQRRRTS